MTDYRVVYADMPTTVKGFVKETDGFYTIVINPKHSDATQRKTCQHELDHICNNDFDADLTADQIERKEHGQN